MLRGVPRIGDPRIYVRNLHHTRARGESRTSLSTIPHSKLRSLGASLLTGRQRVAGRKEQRINSPPLVGLWYTRLDTKEPFLVTAYDHKSRTIETQAINGDLDEIAAEDWNLLPLAFADPPEDWTEVLDEVDVPGAEASIIPIERFLPP